MRLKFLIFLLVSLFCLSVLAAEDVSLIRASGTITAIDDQNDDTVDVTLSANFANNNLKPGQYIVISGTTNYNGTYQIKEVTDQSNFAYYDNTKDGTTAAETTGTAGGHYTTLSAWESAEEGDITETGTDVIAVAECYDDFPTGLDDSVIIDGWTTDVDNYVKITVAPGDRHNGTFQSGFFITDQRSGVQHAQYTIDNQEDYTVIEYLDIDTFEEAIRSGLGAASSMTGVIIRNNIFKGSDPADGGYGFEIDAIDNYIYNNILINFYAAMHLDGTNIVSNNTVIHCNGTGIYSSSPTTTAFNNLVYDCAGNDYQGLNTNGGYNLSADATGDDFGATGSLVNQTLGDIDFVNYAGDDYHIESTSAAAGAGLNTSFQTDIDGLTRDNSAWDIGADQEGTEPTEIVKTIRAGQGITSIARASNVVTVTLDANYPNNNLKVGQTIVIKDVPTITFNGDYTISSITTGVNQTEFTYTQLGIDETDNSGTGTAGGHYETLTAWEADFGGIEFAKYAAFDGDLVTAQKIAVAECYNDWANGLDDSLVISLWNDDRWETSSAYYIKIYAPYGERHDGRPKFEDGSYTGFTMRPSSGTEIIESSEPYTIIEDIILDGTDSSGDGIEFRASYSKANRCIAINANNYAFNLGQSNDYVINCIALDSTVGFRFFNSSSTYAYNVTAAGCTTGFLRDSGGSNGVTVVNALAYGNTDNYNLNLGTGSITYSAANDTDIPAGTGNISSASFTFMDEDNSDFRLHESDTAAKDLGISLKTEIEALGLTVSDINSNSRTSWDIGADEAGTEFIANIRASGQPNEDYNSISDWNTVLVDSPALDFTDGTVKVFAGVLTGTIADGATIALYRSGGAAGVTGTAIHAGASGKVLVKDLSGNESYEFAVNDQWRVDPANYFTISDAGNQPIVVAECFNDWPAGLVEDTMIQLAQVSTDDQHGVVIRASGDQRHTGTAHSGFFIDNQVSAGDGLLAIASNNTKFQGIEIDGSSSTRGSIYVREDVFGYDGLEVSNCLIHDAVSGVYIRSYAGVYTDNNLEKYPALAKVFNNIFYDIAGNALVCHWSALSKEITFAVYNNTIYNSGGNGITVYGNGSNSAGNVFLYNNISVDNSNDYLDQGNGNTTSDFNISTTGTASNSSFADPNLSGSALFVSTTGGSENLRLLESAVAAIDTGRDLTTYANNPYIKELRAFDGNVLLDMNKDERNAPLCIGADEFEKPEITITAAAQNADSDLVTITFTGAMQGSTATVTYDATSCEYSLDNSTWQDMTQYSSDPTTESFTAAGNTGLTYVWDAGPSGDDTNIEDTTVWVRLQTTDANSNQSDITSAYAIAGGIDTAPPSGLDNLAVDSVTATTVSLSWDTASDSNFNHYEIWYGTSLSDVNNRSGSAVEWDDSDDANLATAATTSTSINLALGSTYYFKIWAFDDLAENSALSSHEATTDVLTIGSLTSLDVTPTAPAQVAGSYMVNHQGDMTIEWTLLQNMPVDADIVVTLPAGFDITEVDAADVSSTDIDGTLTAAVSGQAITITRSGGSVVNAGTLIDDLTIADVINPNSYGVTGTYYLSVNDSTGTSIEQAMEINGDDMDGFIITSPVNGDIWGVGTAHNIEWTSSGMTEPFSLQYYTGSGWQYVMDSGATTATNINGVSLYEWAIPSSLALGLTQTVRIFSNANSATAYNVSDEFGISGGLEVLSPNGGENWSIDTVQAVQWKQWGTFSAGVKLEYYDGSAWQPITGGGVDDNGIENGSGATFVSANGDGSTTMSFEWTPSNDMSAGLTDCRIRVLDANTGAPPASDDSAADFTVASITVDYTPPDRTNTAVNVAASNQSISWTAVGVTNIRLEYYSNSNTGYELITSPSSADALAVGSSPFAWTVPDDVSTSTANVYVRAIAVGADGNTSSSGITGDLSDTLDDAFVIYGSLTRTSPTSGSYQVNNTEDRVPIIWTGSSTISDVDFEYCLDISAGTPVWTAISDADLYVANGAAAANGHTVAGSGSTWWQPSVTASNIWIRVKDVNDSGTVSTAAGGDVFSIAGVNITSPDSGVTTTVTYGEEVTIEGDGAGAANVIVYFAESLTDAQNKTVNCHQIGVAGVGGGTWSQSWTVGDYISDTIYLRAENAVSDSIYNIEGPFIIQGSLSVTDPTGPWTVGDTGNTVSGTVGGSISAVELQYSTDGSTWTTLQDDSGVDIDSLAVAGGAFSSAVTVPDAISSNFLLRAIDATNGRAANLLGASSATTAIDVRGALSIDDPADDYIVNRDETITWDATGSLGNVTLYYRAATTSGALSGESWVEFESATASSGGGTASVDGTYTWEGVVDVVDALLAVLDSEGSNIQNNVDINASDVYMQLRVEDADDSNVYSESSAFITRYHQIALRVVDAGGNALSLLNVDENTTVSPAKGAWEVSDASYNGSNDMVVGDYRFYPYNGGGSDNAYSTRIYHEDGGTTYQNTASWRADSDKQVVITVDTAATAAISYTIEISANYDSENDAIDISAWMTKKGMLVQGINDSSSSDYDASAVLNVDVFDDSGAELTASNIASTVDANTNGIFTGIDFDPTDGLTPNATYTIGATLTYNNVDYPGTAIFVIPSVFTYEVKLSATYNSTNDSVLVTSWLERSGTTIDQPGDISINITNSSGVSQFSTSLDGYDILDDPTVDSSLQSNGVYSSIEWDPGTGLTTGEVYTVESSIVYRGKTYRTYTSFAKPEIGEVIDDIAQLTTDVASVSTSVAATQTAVSNVQTSVTQTQTSISTIESQSADILTATEDLPNQIAEAKEEAELARKAEILNRESAVKIGDTVNIRYRTYTGLSPAVDVYTPSNVKVISSLTMTEIGSTGVYEYPVTFKSDWSTGDFTVICTETTNSTMDAITISVKSTDIEDISDKVSSVTGLSSDMSDVKDMSEELTDEFDDLESMLNEISTGLGGSASSFGLEEFGETLSSGSGDGTAPSGELGVVYSKLLEISKKINDLGLTEGMDMESMYEVKEQSLEDITYIRNKTEELRALLEMSKKMVDNVANKPVVQVWYEYE